MLLAITIQDLVSNNYAVVPYSAGLTAVRHALAEKGTTVALVSDQEDRLYGHLTSADALKWTLGADEAKACTGDIAQLCDIVVLPHSSLDRALQLIRAHGEDFLPVVDDTAERHIYRCHLPQGLSAGAKSGVAGSPCQRPGVRTKPD